MVNYLLKINADLENITNLQPQGGCDDPNFSYHFKYVVITSERLFHETFPLGYQFKMWNCGEVTAKETCVTLSETVPLTKSKGTTNLVQKCKFCGRDGTITMIPGRGSPLTLELSESGKFAPLMAFDCRGFEPTDFVFTSGWRAESIEGTKFDEIDLSGDDFTEYDEKGECPVMVSNFRATFEVSK